MPVPEQLWAKKEECSRREQQPPEKLGLPSDDRRVDGTTRVSVAADRTNTATRRHLRYVFCGQWKDDKGVNNTIQPDRQWQSSSFQYLDI